MAEKKKSKLRVFIKKHFSIIVVCAIMLIPSIYTVLFLGSMWDPYGNTQNLPVAVVNQDEAVVYDGGKINIGEQLCGNLRANGSLKFNFVDERVALDGLENGTFYMVMIIPKNFSYNSTTLTSDNPTKMQIKYYTNPGTNYIASKFGESAIKAIKEELNKTVINTYATTVYAKLDTIGEGFTAAADGSHQIYSGAGALKNGNRQITAGLDTLSNGCLTLEEGTGTLQEGLTEYTDGVNQVNDGVKLLNSNSDALNDGAEQLLDGLNTMSDTIGSSLTEENLKDLETLESGLIQLNDGIQTLQKAINEDYKLSDDTIKEINRTIENCEKIIQTDDFENLCELLNRSDIDYDSIKSTVERLLKIPGLKDKEKENIQRLIDMIDLLKTAQAIGPYVTPENAEKVITAAKSLVSAYGQLTDGVQQLSDGGNKALPVASETLKTLSNGLLSVKQGLDQTKEKDGETGLIEGMQTLKAGVTAYTDGVSQVYDGTQQLVANNGKLLSGAGQLNDGAVQLADGSKQLYNGSLEIDAGCTRLMAGAKTLEKSLQNGADQIEQTNTSDEAADMFSQPVTDKEIFLRHINSNGEAMSAYMMCAGLWVACLAYCLMFSPYKTSLAKWKGQKDFIIHAIISVVVAVVQAPIMITLLMAIDGMRPAHVLGTYLMSMLVSVAFMSLIFFVSTLLGEVGSFVLLVLLCLQLSGAAGTYPIELSPKFYQIIHPFMPFSYGVDSFRSTVSTGNPLTTDIIFFVSIIVISGLLTALTFIVRTRIHQKRYEQQIKERLEKEIEYYNAELI